MKDFSKQELNDLERSERKLVQMSNKKKARLMKQLEHRVNYFNQQYHRNLSLNPIDASKLSQIHTTAPKPQPVQTRVVFVPVKQDRKTFLGAIGSALGSNGGAGAGVLGAGAGVAMATMGKGEEESELRHKTMDSKDAEFGLLMFMQNRHRALVQVEGQVLLIWRLYLLYFVHLY